MSNLIHHHYLTPGLISIFVEIRKAVGDKNKNEVHIQHDLNLTHSQFCNLQKLRYWGLIHHYTENGKKAAGKWLITELGGRFLRNETSVPYKIFTQDNVKIQESEERRIIKDYFPNYGDAWFQREFGGLKIDNQQVLIE